MLTQTMKTIIYASVTLGVCLMTIQANAGGVHSRGVPGDRYGYDMRSADSSTNGAHVGARDPFSDGAHVTEKRDPFVDGAHVTDKRNPFVDGSHASRTPDPSTDGAHGTVARMTFAGIDLRGVSAPPAQSIVTVVGA